MNHLKTYESFLLDYETSRNALKSIDSAKISPLSDPQPLGDIYRHIFIKLAEEIDYIPYEHYEKGYEDRYKKKVKCITIGRYHTDTSAFGLLDYYKSMDEAASDVPLRNNITVKIPYNIHTWDDLVELLDRRNLNPFGKMVNILDYNPINFQEIENILDDLGYQLDIENMWAILN